MIIIPMAKAAIMIIEPWLLRALIGGIGIALVMGPLGCFVVWRRMAYFGDSLAHSALLGIALGLLTGMGVNVATVLVCGAFALLLVWLQGMRILATDTLLGILALACMPLGRIGILRRLHHLAQALIPLAGAGVFLGLSATTLSLLRAEHVPLDWASTARVAILCVFNAWSAWLAWRVTGRYSQRLWQRGLAMLGFAAALAVVDGAWWLMFWGWTR